jgi:acetyl esterase/lipase
VEVHHDIELRAASKTAPRQFATIHRPADPARRSGRAVLAFHGGGYCSGHPRDCSPLAESLARLLGVTTVAASYRTGSAEKPTGPGIFADAANAWCWLHRHAAEWGLTPSGFAVHGESAGCLLAGHLALRSPLVEAAGDPLPPTSPSAFLSFWGPVDFVVRWCDNGDQAGAETALFGPGGLEKHPSLYHQWSLLAHLDPDLPPPPPALFVQGSADSVVHPRQALLGCSAWRAAGSEAEWLGIPGMGHGLAALDETGFRCRVLEISAAFLDRAWLRLNGSDCPPRHAVRRAAP